jgi:hypothetical protein
MTKTHRHLQTFHHDKDARKKLMVLVHQQHYEHQMAQQQLRLARFISTVPPQRQRRWMLTIVFTTQIFSDIF